MNDPHALLLLSNLPNLFWNYDTSHAIYLINRFPSYVINSKSPNEIIHQTSPDYINLKVFGCLVFTSTLVQGHQKFDPRTTKSVFLGFEYFVCNNLKGMKILCNNITFSKSTNISTPDYPIPNHLNTSHLPASYNTYISNITSQVEPITYKQASQEDSWKQVMQIELQALQDNNTWTMTTLSLNKKPIRCK